MTALVRAEVLKLRTRMPAWLLLAALCLAVMTVAVTVPTVGAKNNPLSLDEPGLLARAVGTSSGAGEVMVLILGVLAFTQETRFGTLTSTFLVEPRRTRVLVAKWLALALASAVLAAATLAVSITFSIALIRSRDGNVTAGAELWQVLAAVFVVSALYGVIGVAVGALIRNQIVAVVGALVWLLAVEQLLVTLLPAVGRWTPGGASYGLLQLGATIDTRGTLLTAPVGGLLLIGYATAAVALALAVVPRRDVI